jgi:hypothetical protein
LLLCSHLRSLEACSGAYSKFLDILEIIILGFAAMGRFLPLAFSYNFKTISLLELDKEPEVISNLINSVSATQSSLGQTGDFFFVCEVATEIKSAKKFTESPDLTTVIESMGFQTQQ